MSGYLVAPVEAVDQRGADGLHDGPEGYVVEDYGANGTRPCNIAKLADLGPVIFGHAIFGLHEPARRGDAEDIQGVLHATSQEPAVTIETVGMQTATDWTTGKGADQGCPGPVRAAVASVDIGEHVRRHEVADAY